MSEHHGEKPFSLSFTEAGKNNVPILSGNNEYRSQLTMIRDHAAASSWLVEPSWGCMSQPIRECICDRELLAGGSDLAECLDCFQVLDAKSIWALCYLSYFLWNSASLTVDFKENRVSPVWNNFSVILNITVLTSVPSLNPVIKMVQTHILFCTEIHLQACRYK